MKKSEKHDYSKKAEEFMNFHSLNLEKEISKTIIGYLGEIKNKKDINALCNDPDNLLFNITLNSLHRFSAYALAGSSDARDMYARMFQFFHAVHHQLNKIIEDRKEKSSDKTVH